MLLLQGRINGAHDFSIERTTSGKTSSLKLILDGVDQSKQAMKMTQTQLDEMFAADLLAKTCCFNQEQLLGLLSVSRGTALFLLVGLGECFRI